MEKLKLVGKLEEHTFPKEQELKPAELEYIFVCMFDEDNLVRVNNGAVGLAEFPTNGRSLAQFKEVALIDPNFIAFSKVGTVLVFEDMEIIIVDNVRDELCDECIEEAGY